MRVCLNRKEHDRPIRTPTDVDARDMVKKLQSVEGRVLALNDSCSEYSRRKVRNSTIATASFSTLSPNTRLGQGRAEQCAINSNRVEGEAMEETF